MPGPPFPGINEREVAVLDYRFVVRRDGLVRVALPDDAPILNEALEDSIGSRPPRGAAQDGPSTYWLDRALLGVRARVEDASDEPFASGNVTYLQVRHGRVEARYDYDSPDDDNFEAIDVPDFIRLVEEWRDRVLQGSPDADRRLPPSSPARPMPPR